MKEPQERETPGQGAPSPVADKIGAAFDLLASAFQDSRVDSTVLTKDDLLEQVVATQQVLNAAWALQSARLAQAGAIEETFIPDATDPKGFREPQIRHAIGSFHAEFIGSEVGPRLAWTTGQANDRVHEATDAITRTPRLFQRVGTGELEPAKLAAIHRAVGRVARDVAADGTPATLDLARKVEAALLGDPDDADSATVEQRNVELLARQSCPQVQRRTQRILKSLDPVAAREAATKRRRDRIGVFAHPDDEPGLSHLHAILPADTAAKIMAAIDKHARDLRANTTTDKTLAECRADALADLILDNASVATHLVVQVPVHAGVGATVDEAGAMSRPASGTASPVTDSRNAWPTAFAHPVTGLSVLSGGEIAPASARSTMVSQDAVDREFNDLLKRLYPPDPDDWEPPDPDGQAPDGQPPGDREHDDHDVRPGQAPPDATAGRPTSTSPGCRRGPARLGDAVVPGIGIIPAAVIEEMTRSFGMTITRALIDADTGITLETCETRYRPSPALQHFVKTRDQHCRFPGCTRAARWCDVDHVVPSPDGPTAAHNLQCLCRHHHRTKQSHGWSVTMTPDGVCSWTSPSGHTHTTTPGE